MAKVPKYRYDPYGEIIERFNKAGIDYVVVSMSGINYYAQSARDAFMTYDYDIFLKPAFGNVSKAIMILHKAGYETVSTEGPVSKKIYKKLSAKRKLLLPSIPKASLLSCFLRFPGLHSGGFPRTLQSFVREMP